MNQSNNDYKQQWNFLYKKESESNYIKLPWVKDDSFKRLIESLPIKKNSKIIDIGCGTGEISKYLSAQGYDALGVDVSDYIKEEYSKNTQNLKFEEVDITIENSISDKYDVVLAHLLLHHILPEDIPSACENIKKLVKADGIVLLSWLKQEKYPHPVRKGLWGNEDHYLYYHSKDIIAEQFSDFIIQEFKDSTISEGEAVSNEIQSKGVTEFVYQTLVLIPNNSFTEFKKLYLNIKDKLKTNINANKINEIYKDITCELAKIVNKYTIIATKKRANVFLNLQLDDNKMETIIYHIDEDFFISEELQEKSRANYLVKKYNKYYEDTHHNSTSKKFLIHDFFKLQQDEQHIKEVQLYVGNNKVLIKQYFHSQKTPKTTTLEDFFNDKSEWDGESYMEYLNILFFAKSNENQFYKYLEEKGLTNSLPSAIPANYTVWDLSIPNYNYIGSIIIESFEQESIDIPQTILYEIRNIFHVFKIEIAKTRIYQESIKSAVAAIMSRNISHNLGSHVMAYIKYRLQSVNTILSNGTLIDLAEKCDDINTLMEKLETTIAKIRDKDINKKLELPFLVGLGKFLSYLQERQDYIATICTDYIPYFSTVNFKRAIYDELCPDACVARHTDRVGEKADNLLLKFIAHSEGLDRKIIRNNDEDNEYDNNNNNIIIKFRDFDGLYNLVDGKDDLTEMRKISFISLPGGITGRQAFFSIFENIIRNAAKHGNRNGNPNLEFTIDIFNQDTNENETEKKIDNLKNIKVPFISETVNYANFIEIKNDDLYIVTITDNCKTDDNTIKKINAALEEDFINAEGKLLGSNKGIKEMRCSAAWIRNIKELVVKENPDKKVPVLAVRKTENSNLQYIFCVLKSKEIAFVIDDYTPTDEVQITLKNRGCKIFSTKDFIKSTKMSYNFVVIPDDDQIKKKIRLHSHSRLFIKDDWCENVKKDNIPNISELYKELSSNSTETIFISDSKSENLSNCSFINKKDGTHKVTNEEYIYKNHFEDTEEFVSFMKEYFDEVDKGKFKFIEGITGHNSTDRLVRNSELDETWYYKHIHAMKTTVAVFDERIFEKITSIKQSDLNQDTIVKKERTPYINKLKGVYFFNIIYNEIKDEKENVIKKEFVIYGFDKVNHKIENDEYKFENCIYKKIASISEENNQISITPFGFEDKFDYISIHQGLLDKIYDKLEVDTREHKRNITEIIFEKFSNKSIKTVSEKDKDYKFLPQFIIHSGRGKPDKNEMPQKQPFLQFSALENAVMDCKYSLVELLDLAHYERNE